jgi:hypothetical protein
MLSEMLESCCLASLNLPHFRGKTIVVVGMHIPTTTIVFLWMGSFKLVKWQDTGIRPGVFLFHSKC